MNISGGTFKGRKISSPDEKITRPTLSKVRMGVFNTLFSIIGEFENESFLDVFAGSGIMGLEALSRGFSKATLIELNRKSASVIKSNFSNIGVECNLILGDSLKMISKLENKYTVAYVDPPYQSGLYREVVEKLEHICEFIVLEHPTNIEIDFDNIIKQKKYGDKIITYIKN